MLEHLSERKTQLQTLRKDRKNIDPKKPKDIAANELETARLEGFIEGVRFVAEHHRAVRIHADIFQD